MEELRQTAITYYKSAPVEIRVKFDEFFDTMDVNKDGIIEFYEFSSFMSEMGHSLSSFFDEISTEKTNSLNRENVITLFYIIQSGRPLCDGCRRMIKGLYFTCEICFKENGGCFNLHQECFANKQFVHKHANFIDNFALLHIIKRERLMDMTPAPVAYLPPSLTYSSSFHESHQVVNRSLQAQPQENRNMKRMAAFEALKTIASETVVSIASATVASIASEPRDLISSGAVALIASKTVELISSEAVVSIALTGCTMTGCTIM